MSDVACALSWDLDHLGDDEFDVQLIKFEGWESTAALAVPDVYTLPERIAFEANFGTLETIDFPYNDVSWPLMSSRMLKSLRRSADFEHEAVPVVMVNDTVRSVDRYDDDGNARPGVEDHRFFAMNRVPLLDAIDWDASECRRNERYPHLVDRFTRLVLQVPAEGLPPLFRLGAHRSALFVSHSARTALMDEGVEGVEFIELEDFRV